jgi:hypothetical protein
MKGIMHPQKGGQPDEGNVGIVMGKGIIKEIHDRLEKLGYASHYKDVYPEY